MQLGDCGFSVIRDGETYERAVKRIAQPFTTTVVATPRTSCKVEKVPSKHSIVGYRLVVVR